MSSDRTAPDVGDALAGLLSELVDGTPEDESYILNRGDSGLLRSLEAVSWETAGAPGADGGGSIAQHVDHVRYGLSLMNRWAAGEENPFADADWGASWTVTVSSDADWARIRASLGDEAHRWIGSLKDMGVEPPTHPIVLRGVVSSVVHLAYHLGAIRQVAAEARGPRDGAA